jgi:glycosyltransferase involved in cell wall biosynthesis
VSVLPSLYEGQSVAMAEALACGLPVVMTDVNGAREAIDPPSQPSAGAVVPVADLTALLAQLERRRLAPELVAAEATVARSRAVEMFDSARVMERLQTAYVDAIARAARRQARRDE